jgi:hypothetical protein
MRDAKFGIVGIELFENRIVLLNARGTEIFDGLFIKR